MMSYGMEYQFGQSRSAVLVLCPFRPPHWQDSPKNSETETSLAQYSTAQQLKPSVYYRHCPSPKAKAQYHTKHYEKKISPFQPGQ